jgi:PKD repeat protein
MKIIYLTLLSLCFCFSGVSQNSVKTPIDNTDVKLCGQYEVLQKMRQEFPEKYESYMNARMTPENEAVEKSGTIYKIPVVFHILHNNGTENITDAQVQSALDVLNRDFRKLNSDANSVVSQFTSIVADAEIEFVFATIAPNGTCFNGITRTVSSATSSGSNGQTQVNAVVAGNNVYQGVWPHNMYLNIYVCKNLVDAGTVGYTFNPNNEGYGSAGATISATNMYYNGVFMKSNYIGTIGTSSAYNSRALTHEVGHWLNLDHTWGPGNIGTCGTDNVSDTPQTNGSANVCTLSKTSCDGTLDNVENYMDYSFCSKMFTQGQVTRMRNAIVNAMGGRSNIWTNTNLQSVGAIPGTSICSADFQATLTGLCTGNSTTFSVTNTSATITSYSWTFTGGTPATSTAASPTVTYSTTGAKQVSVVVTTASGSHTITKAAYINVASAGTPVTLPITEGFTSATFPPTNWSLTNGGAANTWVRNTTVGRAPTAGNSVVIDYYNSNVIGDIDDLNTPTFSLSTSTSASLAFDVAYRPHTQYFDKLEVLVSPGCGAAYEVVYSKAGAALQTETAATSAYTSPSTWRRETIDLTPYVGANQVSVKFRGTSGYGNYLYLDNINISAAGSLGIEHGENTAFSIFPNPTNGEVTVSSSSPIDEITVLDNTGRVVQTIKGDKSTEIKLELNHLSSGSYHLQIRMNGNFKMDKLIIQ